jgi:hypothetical protein
VSSLEITLLDADRETFEELATIFNGSDVIKVQKVDRVLYTHPPSGLDAVFLVVPAAERWGAKPVPGAQVLKTSVDDQRDGMTPYVVAGGVLRAGDPRDPVQDARMVVGTVLNAIREFNQANRDKEIRKLGFWVVNLLGGVTPQQLSAVFAGMLGAI